MNSNQLIEHIRLLNAEEAKEKEIRRQLALNKIKYLREQIREKQNGIDIHQRIRQRQKQEDCTGL